MDKNWLDTRWQRYMRPVMIGMLVALTVFFFVATLFQLVNLNTRIGESPRLDAATLFTQTTCSPNAAEPACLVQRRLSIAAALEVHTIALRHHEANVLLMAAIWSRYLGFVTGMILALVGAAFILGKLTDGGTDLGVEGEAVPVRLALATASPGIVMVISGVALMIVTIMTLHQFSTRDAAIYFAGEGIRMVDPGPSIYSDSGAGGPAIPTK